jgi:hypothetical protein
VEVEYFHDESIEGLGCFISSSANYVAWKLSTADEAERQHTLLKQCSFPGKLKAPVAGPGTDGEFMAGMMTLVGQ